MILSKTIKICFLVVFVRNNLHLERFLIMKLNVTKSPNVFFQVKKKNKRRKKLAIKKLLIGVNNQIYFNKQLKFQDKFSKFLILVETKN